MKTSALVLSLCAASASAAGPDVSQFSALATDGAVRLRWSNPTGHAGVMILRATTEVVATPVDGLTYAVDAALGNATVAYAAGATPVTFLDAGRTNGTKVHYRIHSRNDLGQWSAGLVPSSSGLSATPRAATGSNPRWCTAIGTSAVMQPVVDVGVGVYFAGNGGSVNAAITNAGQADDGDERWRPITLLGNVQGRFPVVTLYGRSTKAILTGDSSGRGWAYDASTGAQLWAALAQVPMGDAIIAQPAVQLRAYANAAYATANPATDLVFFATRNGNALTNAVVAVYGSTGALAWTYVPGDLDVINGGMFVDYVNNRLWVASRSNGGTQQSLRVLDSLTGAKLAGFSVGDVDNGVVRNPSSNQALVANTAGVVTGVDLDALTIAFQQSVGAANSWPFPIGTGFIVSLASGAVERWSVSGATATRLWTTGVTNPTGVNLEYTAQVAYVGSTDGKLHQLSLATGADQLQIDLGDDGVGTPSIDVTASRIHVGTLGGHVCAVPLP